MLGILQYWLYRGALAKEITVLALIEALAGENTVLNVHVHVHVHVQYSFNRGCLPGRLEYKLLQGALAKEITVLSLTWDAT